MSGQVSAQLWVIEKNAGSGYQAVYTQAVSDPNTVWVDEDVQVDAQSYQYRVYVTDSCGTQTPGGRTARSLLLQAERSGGSVFLTWNPYEEWETGVREYLLEVYNEATLQYDQVAQWSPGTYRYVDRETILPQQQYCYRIRAHELGGNQLTSISNTACVPVGPLAFYPNAFTPNGDQNNDRFVISGIFIARATLQIFSRRGEKVYESTDLAEGWDGTYQGAKVAEGVYVFKITGEGFDGTSFAQAGTVTLIR